VRLPPISRAIKPVSTIAIAGASAAKKRSPISEVPNNVSLRSFGVVTV